MDDTSKIYTARRWEPPPINDAPDGRFDDESLYNIQDKAPPVLVWFGDTPPEPPPMLVRDLLPQGQVVIMAGVYSSGKTFVANALAACVMSNIPFAGREIVRPGGVLWLAAEGANEIDARMKAAAQAQAGDDDTRTLPFARQAFDVPRLTAPEAEAQLVAHVDAFKGGLAERFPDTDLVMIVIDTLGSAAGFVDGNSSAEAQRVMDMLRRVNTATGALVLVVDHFGKVAETGVMGASAKAQSADAVLAILADKTIEGDVTNRRMVLHKMRGGAGGIVTGFRLRQVLVGNYGGTTCVVEWDAVDAVATPAAKPEKPAWNGKARLLKSAIERATIDHGELIRPFGGDGPEVKAAEREKIRAEFYASYPAEDTATKRQAFNRLMDNALTSSLVAARELSGIDWVWLAKDDPGPRRA